MSEKSCISQETELILSSIFIDSLKEELKKGVLDEKDLSMFIKSIMSIAYFRGVEDSQTKKVASRETFF